MGEEEGEEEWGEDKNAPPWFLAWASPSPRGFALGAKSFVQVGSKPLHSLLNVERPFHQFSQGHAFCTPPRSSARDRAAASPADSIWAGSIWDGWSRSGPAST